AVVGDAVAHAYLARAAVRVGRARVDATAIALRIEAAAGRRDANPVRRVGAVGVRRAGLDILGTGAEGRVHRRIAAHRLDPVDRPIRTLRETGRRAVGLQDRHRTVAERTASLTAAAARAVAAAASSAVATGSVAAEPSPTHA